MIAALHCCAISSLTTPSDGCTPQGINQDVRVDGRGRLDYRYLTVECGLLPQANGSARISLINGNTDVVAAVKVPCAHTQDTKCKPQCLSPMPPNHRRNWQNLWRAFLIEAVWSALWTAGHQHHHHLKAVVHKTSTPSCLTLCLGADRGLRGG